MLNLNRLIVALSVFFVTPANAQDSCICFKCLFGQVKMVKIYGNAMAPEFETGQCNIVRYLNEDYERLAHGDVIFFTHPILQANFLERVVGMGGDTVQMIDGRVSLNGVRIPQRQMEEYERPFVRSGPTNILPQCQNRPEIGGTCTTERFTETMPNGNNYEVLNIRDTAVDNTDIFYIPEGYVVVLGDNRDNSIGSRFSQSDHPNGVGFVPLENTIGVMEDN